MLICIFIVALLVLVFTNDIDKFIRYKEKQKRDKVERFRMGLVNGSDSIRKNKDKP